jgi:hypothetical protein
MCNATAEMQKESNIMHARMKGMQRKNCSNDV